jgi:hypothetical protein
VAHASLFGILGWTALVSLFHTVSVQALACTFMVAMNLGYLGYQATSSLACFSAFPKPCRVVNLEICCHWCRSRRPPDPPVMLHAPASALSLPPLSSAASLASWRHRTCSSWRLHARAQPFDTPLGNRAHHGYPAPVPFASPSAAPSSRSTRVSVSRFRPC